MARFNVERGGAGSWVLGGLIAFFGLLGLFLASRALDGTVYWVGLLAFLFSIFFNFNLIVSHTGQKSH